jgi:hypothetical protein
MGCQPISARWSLFGKKKSIQHVGVDLFPIYFFFLLTIKNVRPPMALQNLERAYTDSSLY